jgi:hypothetical protein
MSKNKLASHIICTSHYTMNSCYDIQLHTTLLFLCTKCKKLTQLEGHVLSHSPQVLCLKLLKGIALKFGTGER